MVVAQLAERLPLTLEDPCSNPANSIQVSVSFLFKHSIK